MLLTRDNYDSYNTRIIRSLPKKKESLSTSNKKNEIFTWQKYNK